MANGWAMRIARLLPPATVTMDRYDCWLYVWLRCRARTRRGDRSALLAFELVDVLRVLIIHAFAFAVLPLTARVALHAQIAVIVRLTAARQDRAPGWRRRDGGWRCRRR